MTTLPLITQIALARRAVLAGAPIGDPRAITVVAVGPIGRDGEGKAYFVHKGNSGTDTEWLPLLSDRSWLGWVTGEVESRGYDYSVCLSEERHYCSIFRRATGSRPMEGHYKSREAAMVAMLEATK